MQYNNPSSLRNRFRDWIHRSPRATVTIVALVLLTVLIYSSSSFWSKPNAAKEIKLSYIDEETGALTAGTFADVPPMIGASGRPTVVRAVFYTCPGSKERKIAFYKKYTDEAKTALEAALKKDTTTLPLAMIELDRQALVRLPAKGSPWVPIDSEEGKKVILNFDCPEGPESAKFAN